MARGNIHEPSRASRRESYDVSIETPYDVKSAVNIYDVSPAASRESYNVSS